MKGIFKTKYGYQVSIYINSKRIQKHCSTKRKAIFERSRMVRLKKMVKDHPRQEKFLVNEYIRS